MKFLFFLIKALLTLLVYFIALLGIWIFTSLVAYFNGPDWLCLLSGILFFPLFPLTWELFESSFSTTKSIKPKLATLPPTPVPIQPIISDPIKSKPKKKKMNSINRFAIKTLIINLLLISCLLWLAPDMTFNAIKTKGDWMLVYIQDTPYIEDIRQKLSNMANSLEAFYNQVHRNWINLNQS